jgi:hypothetical protein
MTSLRHLAAFALVPPIAVALAAPVDRLERAPRVSSKTSVTYRHDGELELTDMSIEVDGKAKDPYLVAGFEQHLATSYEVAFTDEVLEVETGRITRFERTYDALGSSTTTSVKNDRTGDEGWTSEDHSASELEGRRVVFSREPDQDSFARAFASGGGDGEDLLASLGCTYDLAEFLPAKPVEAGARWTLSHESDRARFEHAIRSLYAPGGRLELKPQATGKAARRTTDLIQPAPDEFLGELSGTVRAHYVGAPSPGAAPRAAESSDLREIELEVTLRSSKDVKEAMGVLAQANGFPLGLNIAFERFEVVLHFAGSGRLLWNIAEGRADSLVLEGRTELLFDTEMRVKDKKQIQLLVQSLSLATPVGASERFEVRFASAE